MYTLTVFPRVGWTVDQSIEFAVDTAKRRRSTVEIEINDILLSIDPQSKVGAIKNMYLKMLNAKNR